MRAQGPDAYPDSPQLSEYCRYACVYILEAVECRVEMQKLRGEGPKLARPLAVKESSEREQHPGIEPL